MHLAIHEKIDDLRLAVAVRNDSRLIDRHSARIEIDHAGRLRTQMLKYLEARLHLAGRSRLGLIQIQQALEDAGVPPSITIALIDLLEQCGRHRYSPDPPDTAERLDLFEQAEKLLAVVDKEAVSKKRLSALSDGSKVLAVLALWMVLAARGR